MLSLETRPHSTVLSVMDIEEWLQGTASASKLSPRPHRDVLPAVAPTNAVEHGERQRKKLDKSRDSSIIEPQQIPRSKREGPLPGAAELQHTSRDGTFSSIRSSVEETSHQCETNPYQRRKRRKTRHDRYDEKPAHSSSRVRSKRKAGQKPKDRPRIRKVKGASQDAVVRDYRAKNVSTDRLTVCPTATFMHTVG